MRPTRRTLVVAAAVAALALMPLGAATANPSPTAVHSVAMGSIPLGTPACC